MNIVIVRTFDMGGGYIIENMGTRLKQLRKKYNYSQKDIGNFIGVSQSQVAKVESDERHLKLTQLTKLSNLYSVPVDYILTGEGNPIIDAPRFKKDNKGISLDTIMKMNKIVLNLHEMIELAEKHNIK